MNNVRSFHVTRQGANHIKKNKICQDYSVSFEDDEYISYAIVCDGHGGDDYIRSDEGSKRAAQVAGSAIVDFVHTVLVKYDIGYLQRHYEELLRGLAASIITQWRQSIQEHLAANPFSEAELAKVSEKARERYSSGNIASAYGTTLIAVVFTEDYWFGIKIGDGKCVAVDGEGNFSMPIPDDGVCFLNATTSICDTNAIDNFRYAFSPHRPVAVFAGTDGIDDCFNKDEQLFSLYKTILYSFARSQYDEAKEGLEDYLPRLSAKGSGDDMSIGGIIDIPRLEGLDFIVDFDTTPKVQQPSASEEHTAPQPEAQAAEAAKPIEPEPHSSKEDSETVQPQEPVREQEAHSEPAAAGQDGNSQYVEEFTHMSYSYTSYQENGLDPGYRIQNGQYFSTSTSQKVIKNCQPVGTRIIDNKCHEK